MKPDFDVLAIVCVVVSKTETVPLFAMPVAGSTTTGFDPSGGISGLRERPPQLLTYTLRPSLLTMRRIRK